MEVTYLNITGSDKLDLGKTEWNQDVIKKAKELGATHMVAEVVRGGRACVSFESQVQDHSKDRTIKGVLKAEM